jgi:hypothetical protein
VARQHERHAEADSCEHFRDLHERSEVLLVGRRVHDDIAAGVTRESKITPKARVRGRRLDAPVGESQIIDDPAIQRREAQIARRR